MFSFFNSNMLAIITAMDENRLIGKNNSLPWHLPADLQYFKQTTMGSTIIMGHKTFKSIGKPLPGRKNIILTRDRNLQINNCKIIHSIQEIKQFTNAFIIGGSNIYNQTLNLIDKLYITQVYEKFFGDVYFPEIDNSWELLSNEKHTKDEINKYNYAFKIFKKNIIN